jgi:2-dehydro-3-deoxyphosphogluconate aldolase/(4S)-4-hydroxy-2-oxoglutarate aldolase
VIPVLVIEDAATARPLAEALVRGGLRVLEVTLRTAAAMDAIRDTELPGNGAGARPMKVALFPKIAVGDAPMGDTP